MNYGLFANRWFQSLCAPLILSLGLALPSPAFAQAKWRHAMVLAKADSGFIYMAQEKGFFQKRGLDVEYVTLRGDKDVLRALLAGEADSAELQPGATLTAMEHGADLRFIGAMFPGFPYALYVRKDITRWDQLKDKTFGVSSPGSVPEIIARAMMLRKGVDSKNIKIVAAGGSASRVRALASGKIDAAASSTEFIPQIDKLGIRVMGMAADIVPEFPRFVLIAKESTLKARREETINFLAAYMEGMDYATKPQHRDETLALAGKITHKPANDPELVHMYDEVMDKGYISVTSEIPRTKIEWLQNELIKLGEIKKKIDLDKVIDESYRKEALKRVKL